MPKGHHCCPFGSSTTAGPPRKQPSCRSCESPVVVSESKSPQYQQGTYISERISDSQFHHFPQRLGDLGAIAASESGLQHLGMRQLGAGPVLRAAVSHQLRRHIHWRLGREMGWMGWLGWDDVQHFEHFQAFGDVCDRLLLGLQHQSQPLGGMDPTQLQADDVVGTVI